MTGTRDKNRVAEMYALFCGGMLLREIGERYGVSHQRVSHIFKMAGLDQSAGGRLKIGKDKAAQAASDKDEKSLRKYGMPYSEYWALARSGVARRYSQQKKAAKDRGIAWEFNLASWWKVWQDSGKWEQRGRGSGKFAMARFGDEGSYRPDNVEIITHNQNSTDCREWYWAEYYAEKKGKSKNGTR